MTTTYRILVADDHPLFRSALREALEPEPAAAEVEIEWLEASTFAQCLQLIQEGGEIDLVLLDLSMPDNQGLMGLLQLRSAYPALAVAIISATDSVATIRNALNNGALGYIPKSTSLEQIRQALGHILEGQRWVPPQLELGGDDDQAQAALDKLANLTPQQLKVLGMIARGLLNKQIAAELAIKETTVKTHISEIFDRLGIINRTQAAMFTQHLETR